MAILVVGCHAEVVRQTTCNQLFMESFDVMGQQQLAPDRNYICPGVMSNCCSLQTQLDIYKKWIISGEKKKIKSFYAEFPKMFDRIYASFEQVEALAASVLDATLGVSGSNCNRIASVIVQSQLSNMREKVVTSAKIAANFLFRARQGMYCSLCDADNHPFYNNTEFSITMASQFCAKFVENALPFYIFKYEYFVKISRLVAQFLQQCSLRGVYRPTKFLRNDLKFFRHRDFEGHVRTCKSGLSKPGAINACTGFCSRFNPIKYDSSLEGEIDKLANFAMYLERRIRIVKLEEKRASESEKEADKQPENRRILEVEDEKKVQRKPQLDEETDELIAFNRQFQTALLRPVSYRFKSDLAIKYNVQFDEPIIRTGFERIFDIIEFKGRFAEDGINYNSYGQMINIDREVAMKIFEIINPEKQTGFSFEDFLRSK